MKIALSNQGPILSRIVAGVMNWGDWGAKLATKPMAELVSKCVEMGVTSFDHADIYGGYTTEADFGRAFGETGIDRKTIQIITKCGICYPCQQRPGFKIKSYNTSGKYIIKAVDQSLLNLKTDYIDLLLIHRPSPIMDYREMAETLGHLKEVGKINHAGVSNFTNSQFDAFRQFHPLATNQIEASILHLDPFLDGSLDYCQSHHLKPMAWSSLGGGSLFRPITDYERATRRARLLACCRKMDIPIDKLAYLFLLHHPTGILPVTGSSKVERIKTAVDALAMKITDEQWFELWTASTGSKVP